ncbi:cobyrinate a,c-diamide synthase [Microlunatus sp. GCM10028923]|uniref:cobyrinate a,c-diamide synthase n=1 Tax=Microlunatus sp. GCM10028923 TaxID=3273400 RepID=UPI00361A4FBB
MNPPAAGVLVAGSHSGAGKTTVTAVLLAAARRRGLDVRPFKLGPDFIDPGYHAAATGRESINLDRWMMGEAGIKTAYQRWADGGELAVIEAMGALYDGEDGSGRGSAAELAKLLGVPVIIVLDVWGMTRTTAAVLDGLIGFDAELPVAGWILNRVGSAGHAKMIMDALPDRLRDGVLGWIRHDDDLGVPERHLGLVTTAELAVPAERRERALINAAEHLDLDRLIGDRPLSSGGPAAPHEPTSKGSGGGLRLAVAWDDAFCFRYPENLRLLREAGFEPVPFRPTVDPALPPDVAVIYLCGGYPESFAAQLAGNTSLAAELRDRAAAGTPILAECGGLIYLARTLTDFDGRTYPMCGVLPLDVIMDRDHLAIRYVEARTLHPSPLGPAGTTVRGQEFHQSRILASDLEPNLFETVTSAGGTGRDGYLRDNVLACYSHLYLGSNPAIAEALASAARGVRRPG